MARDFTAEQAASVLERERDDAWLLLAEVDIPMDPPTRLRLARNAVDVTFGEFGDGTALTYQAAQFEIDGVEDDTEGTLRQITLTISNVTREAIAWLEHYSGLVGQPARILIVNSAELDSVEPYWDAPAEVLSSSAERDTVQLVLGHRDIARRRFPAQLVLRDTCRFSAGAGEARYGGDLCGYDTTRSGSLQACDFTYAGPNGCTAHGDDEVAAGLPRLHPLRWGGFLGVPRKAGLGSG